MKNKICWILGILICAGVLWIFFLAGRCSTRAERIQQLNNLQASRDSIKRYQVHIGQLTSSVQEKVAIILSQEQALQAGVLERERLRALHLKQVATNVQLEGVIRVLRDSLALPHKTEIVTVKDTSGWYDCVKIPFQLLNVQEPYLNLTVGMSRERLAWFDLTVPLEAQVTVGWKREGFLKPTRPVGMFVTENPYVKMNNMEVLITQPQKRFVDRWWVHVLGGVMVDEGIRWVLKK